MAKQPQAAKAAAPQAPATAPAAAKAAAPAAAKAAAKAAAPAAAKAAATAPAAATAAQAVLHVQHLQAPAQLAPAALAHVQAFAKRASTARANTYVLLQQYAGQPAVFAHLHWQANMASVLGPRSKHVVNPAACNSRETAHQFCAWAVRQGLISLAVQQVPLATPVGAAVQAAQAAYAAVLATPAYAQWPQAAQAAITALVAAHKAVLPAPMLAYAGTLPA